MNNKKIIVHNGSLTSLNIATKVMHYLRTESSNLLDSYLLDSDSIDEFNEFQYDTYVLRGPEYDIPNIVNKINQNIDKRKVNIICFWNNIFPFLENSDFNFKNISLYVITPKIDTKTKEFIDQKNAFADTKDIKLNYASILAYISAKSLFDSFEDYYAGNYLSLVEAMHSKEFEVFGNRFKYDSYGDRISDPFEVYHYEKDSFEKSSTLKPLMVKILAIYSFLVNILTIEGLRIWHEKR